MPPLQAETKEHLLSQKQGKVFPHKVISLATDGVNSLAIGKEVLQAHPRPIFLTWLSASQEIAHTRWIFMSS